MKANRALSFPIHRQVSQNQYQRNRKQHQAYAIVICRNTNANCKCRSDQGLIKRLDGDYGCQNFSVYVISKYPG